MHWSDPLNPKSLARQVCTQHNDLLAVAWCYSFKNSKYKTGNFLRLRRRLTVIHALSCRMRNSLGRNTGRLAAEA